MDALGQYPSGVALLSDGVTPGPPLRPPITAAPRSQNGGRKDRPVDCKPEMRLSEPCPGVRNGGVRASIYMRPGGERRAAKCSSVLATLPAKQTVADMVRGSISTYRLRSDLLEAYLQSQFPGHGDFNVQVGALLFSPGRSAMGVLMLMHSCRRTARSSTFSTRLEP